MPDDRPLSPSMSPNRAILRKNQSVCPQEMVQEDMKILEPRSDPILRMGVTPREITERIAGFPRQPRSAQILTADSVQQQPIAAPEDQRSTTESTEIHGKENPNQLPLSVSFGVFRGYPFVMILLAGVIPWPILPVPAVLLARCQVVVLFRGFRLFRGSIVSSSEEPVVRPGYDLRVGRPREPRRPR